MNTPGSGSHRQACPEGKFILSSEPFLARVRQDPGRAFGRRFWRLKFLQKVGIPEKPRGATETVPGLDDEPTSSSQSGGDAEGGGSAEEMVVVQQQAVRKSTDDIRGAYIKKLENSRAFIPQLNRPKTSQTVTIFDWDDTLLCTTHLEMLQRQHGSIPAQACASRAMWRGHSSATDRRLAGPRIGC